MWTMTSANHPGYSGWHSPIPRCGRGPSRSMPFKRSKSVSAGSLVQNASMGPPPFGSGNSAPVGPTSPGKSSFNGATANGATAFRQWKLVVQALVVLVEHVPSMGPPPFGSGNGRFLLPGAGAGAAFNGATAFRQWKLGAQRPHTPAHQSWALGNS